MAMKTILKLLIPFFLVSQGLLAQGVDDAIYLAQTRYEGTARSMAMGNATGAMGGDLTAVCINPAALGLYRGSEFTFSTGLQHATILSSYYGTNDSNSRLRLSIPNIGFVMGGEVSNYKPLRYMQISLGMTRTNDYSYRSLAQGINPSSSMVDAFLQTANGIDALLTPSAHPGNYFADYYPYDLNPAWETYLIDRYVDSAGRYYFDSPVPPGNVNQKDAVTCKGRSEEWTAAWAGNFYNKLFVGCSLGLVRHKRISSRTYTENDDSFGYWSYQENLADTAWGVNVKCGLVYFPTSWLRIGAAWHSRTLSSIGELWSTDISTTFNNGLGYHKYNSPSLYQTYEFRSPHSFTGSLAFLFRSRGMITTDVDYLDYGTSKLSSDDFSFSDANNDIRTLLKPSLNIRIGAEWRLRQYFIRGGMAYYGSPYGFGERYGSNKKMSLGIGYATEDDILWDFAYELSRGIQGYTPYQCFDNGQNIVDDIVQHRWRNKIVATMKMKF